MVGGRRLSTGKEGKMAGAKTWVAAERDLSGFFFFSKEGEVADLYQRDRF
jgi:hypothetical protein